MSETARPRETVGSIGVGFMGHGMARNILKRNYPLTFLGGANRPPAEDLTAYGGVEVSSAKNLAEQTSIIFLCVTGSAEVESIVNGSDGLKAGLKAGSVVVDCSTSDPNSTVAIAHALETLGVEYADAPLGGTPK